MVLDGAQDQIEAPPTDNALDDPDHDGVVNEIPTSLVDFMEFYLLNYFKPAVYQQTDETRQGRVFFERIGCSQCHVPDLQIARDRRVADVETFLVRNIFTDFKRHNLGPNFFERNFDGTIRKEFLTTALWGVGSTSPYGHDGRSVNLLEVILRHGGEAQGVRDAFGRLSSANQERIIAFLETLIVFPPDDTASTLDPGDRSAFNFPQFGHGSIRLSALFNNPNDPE
jgi:CxxC motif-containing protein (DUF1111 family)